MDEVLEYNRKTLTDVYMTEVDERTEDVQNKISFLHDQLVRNETPAILQQDVDIIRERGRHLKEQVDALVVEFETKYHDLKTTRTEHIKKIEKEYSTYLLKLKAESTRCDEVCNSDNLQEVESFIKTLDELLNHTNLPNIELGEDFFEPAKSATIELKYFFGELCSRDIPVPDSGDTIDKAPDVDMGDNSDITSLIDSEHGTTPKSVSVQGDIASEKSFVQSEASGKSEHGDLEDVDNGVEDSGNKEETIANEAAPVNQSEIQVQDKTPQLRTIQDDNSFVEEDLDVTDTSQVLEKEDDRTRLQDTKDELASEKSRYSYASSYEDAESSKSSSVPKLKDADDAVSLAEESKIIVKDDRSLIGDTDSISKDGGQGGESSVKEEEIKSDPDDSLVSANVERSVNEAFIPIPIVVSPPPGQGPSDDKPQPDSDGKQTSQSDMPDDIDRKIEDGDVPKALPQSVPSIQVMKETDSKETQEFVDIPGKLDNGASEEYPNANVIPHVKDTEVLKQKADVVDVKPKIITDENRDGSNDREGLRRISIDVDNEEGRGAHIPTQPTHSDSHDILDVIHTFKVRGGDEVISICPLSSGECAWIARQKGKHVFRAIKMVSRSGKVVQTSGFPRAVVDISVDRSDGILVTCTDSVVRQMLAVDKSVVKFETDEDLTSLGQLSTGNIVVCHYLTSKVALLHSTGEVLDCLDGKGRDRAIVGNPWKVRVNENNDDIAIINRQGPSSIVVVDKNLNLRFLFDGTNTYTASTIPEISSAPREIPTSAGTTSGSNYDNRFIPVDACFDASNNIIIAEYNRKAVLVLDAEGRLLGTLYNECTRPTSLAVDSRGHLWVGYSNGKVDIIRHLSEKINWLK